jgi:hypothetical protein
MSRQNGCLVVRGRQTDRCRYCQRWLVRESARRYWATVAVVADMPLERRVTFCDAGCHTLYLLQQERVRVWLA